MSQPSLEPRSRTAIGTVLRAINDHHQRGGRPTEASAHADSVTSPGYGAVLRDGPPEQAPIDDGTDEDGGYQRPVSDADAYDSEDDDDADAAAYDSEVDDEDEIDLYADGREAPSDRDMDIADALRGNVGDVGPGSAYALPSGLPVGAPDAAPSVDHDASGSAAITDDAADVEPAPASDASHETAADPALLQAFRAACDDVVALARDLIGALGQFAEMRASEARFKKIVALPAEVDDATLERAIETLHAEADYLRSLEPVVASRAPAVDAMVAHFRAVAPLLPQASATALSERVKQRHAQTAPESLAGVEASIAAIDAITADLVALYPLAQALQTRREALLERLHALTDVLPWHQPRDLAQRLDGLIYTTPAEAQTAAASLAEIERDLAAREAQGQAYTGARRTLDNVMQQLVALVPLRVGEEVRAQGGHTRLDKMATPEELAATLASLAAVTASLTAALATARTYAATHAALGAKIDRAKGYLPKDTHQRLLDASVQAARMPPPKGKPLAEHLAAVNTRLAALGESLERAGGGEAAQQAEAEFLHHRLGVRLSAPHTALEISREAQQGFQTRLDALRADAQDLDGLRTLEQALDQARARKQAVNDSAVDLEILEPVLDQLLERLRTVGQDDECASWEAERDALRREVVAAYDLPGDSDGVTALTARIADLRERALAAFNAVPLEHLLEQQNDSLAIPADALHAGRNLKSGAFGMTRLVHGTPGKPLVGKVPKQAAQDDDASRAARAKGYEDLEHEAEIYARLGKHDNIAQCYGVHDIDGEPTLLLENIDGGDLGDVFKDLEKRLQQSPESGGITRTEYLGTVQHMIKGILQGLAHCEAAGIVHMDVKPDNVRFDKDTGQPKLIDMGLAQQAGLAENLATHTTLTPPEGGVSLPAAPRIETPDRQVTVPVRNQRTGEISMQTISPVRSTVSTLWDSFAVGKALYPLMEKDAARPDEHFQFVGLTGARVAHEVQGAMSASSGAFEERTASFSSVVTTPKQIAADGSFVSGTLREANDEAAQNRAAIKPGEYRAMTDYVDFMNRLTHFDPAQRLSPRDALKHPFMANALLEGDAALKIVRGARSEPDVEAFRARLKALKVRRVTPHIDAKVGEAALMVRNARRTLGEATSTDEEKAAARAAIAAATDLLAEAESEAQTAVAKRIDTLTAGADALDDTTQTLLKAARERTRAGDYSGAASVLDNLERLSGAQRPPRPDDAPAT